MPRNSRSLREPEERVGQCSNAALPPPSVSEESLVQRLRVRDGEAIRLLYERYQSALHHVALQFVHRTEDAEEVVQLTWMAVLAGIDRFGVLQDMAVPDSRQSRALLGEARRSHSSLF
jgi:hypothetical protein